MFRRILTEERGYSLVEVMVAIMILAIAIIPMVSMFDAGLRAAVSGSSYDQARALANEKLEETKVLSFPDALARYPEDSPTDCNPPPPASTPVTSCKVTIDYVRLGASAIESSSYEPTNTIQVTVRVEWSGGSYEIKGLIAR